MPDNVNDVGDAVLESERDEQEKKRKSELIAKLFEEQAEKQDVTIYIDPNERRVMSPLNIAIARRLLGNLTQEETRARVDSINDIDGLKQLLAIDYGLRSLGERGTKIRERLADNSIPLQQIHDRVVAESAGLIDQPRLETVHQQIEEGLRAHEQQRRQQVETVVQQYEQQRRREIGRNRYDATLGTKIAFAFILAGIVSTLTYTGYQAIGLFRRPKTNIIQNTKATERAIDQILKHKTFEKDGHKYRLVEITPTKPEQKAEKETGKEPKAEPKEFAIEIPSLEKIVEAKYMTLNRNPEAQRAYDRVMRMEETTIGAKPKPVKEKIVKKADALKQLIEKYPGTLTAFNAQRKISLMYGSNPGLFAVDETLPELSRVIDVGYDTRELNLSELGNLARRFYELSQRKYTENARQPAAEDTVKWLADKRKTSGSVTTLRINYLLGSLGAKQEPIYGIGPSEEVDVDDSLKRAVSLKPESIATYLRESANGSNERASRGMAFLGDYYLSTKKYDKAIIALEHSLQYAQSTTLPWLPESMYDLGIAYERFGAVAKGDKVLEELIKNYPTTGQAIKAKTTLGMVGEF